MRHALASPVHSGGAGSAMKGGSTTSAATTSATGLGLSLAMSNVGTSSTCNGATGAHADANAASAKSADLETLQNQYGINGLPSIEEFS